MIEPICRKFVLHEFPGKREAFIPEGRAKYLEKYEAVRQYVFLRDNYICSKCGKKGYHNLSHGQDLKLTTHHVKPICHYGDELDPNNQVAMHFACHKMIQP